MYETADELLGDLKGVEPGVMERLERGLKHWSSYRPKGRVEVRN